MPRGALPEVGVWVCAIHEGACVVQSVSSRAELLEIDWVTALRRGGRWWRWHGSQHCVKGGGGDGGMGHSIASREAVVTAPSDTASG